MTEDQKPARSDVTRPIIDVPFRTLIERRRRLLEGATLEEVVRILGGPPFEFNFHPTGFPLNFWRIRSSDEGGSEHVLMIKFDPGYLGDALVPPKMPSRFTYPDCKLHPGTVQVEGTIDETTSKAWRGATKDELTQAFGGPPYEERLDGDGNGEMLWRFFSIDEVSPWDSTKLFRAEFEAWHFNQAGLLLGT